VQLQVSGNHATYSVCHSAPNIARHIILLNKTWVNCFKIVLCQLHKQTWLDLGTSTLVIYLYCSARVVRLKRQVCIEKIYTLTCCCAQTPYELSTEFSHDVVRAFSHAKFFLFYQSLIRYFFFAESSLYASLFYLAVFRFWEDCYFLQPRLPLIHRLICKICGKMQFSRPTRKMLFEIILYM